MIAEMITAGVAITDRVIQLIDRREKVDRAFFVDFIQPTMSDLEAAHKDYLESFRRYVVVMSDVTIPFTESHPVLSEIKRDIILSDSLRTKAHALQAGMLASGRWRNQFGIADDDVLSEFLGTITDYFGTVVSEPMFRDGEPPDAGVSQVRSYLLNVRLVDTFSENIPEPERRWRGIKAVDETIEDLQWRYRRVHTTFTELRMRLLTPR
ncbi:hypothetical protein [Paraburkholderia sp. MM6662-R1]|uniref:hypothetical protein n=1 Tax=Paraburkholderia sp. MM6662-R1 TaxID=2991066 RepID=UPI003D24B190